MNVGRLELICIRRDATRPRAQRTNGSWRASSGRRRVNSTIILLLLPLLFISIIIITIIVLSYVLPVTKLCTRYILYVCYIPPPPHDPPHTPSTLTPPPPAALVTSYSLHCLVYFFLPPLVPSFVLGLHTATDLYLRSILYTPPTSPTDRYIARSIGLI